MPVPGARFGRIEQISSSVEITAPPLARQLFHPRRHDLVASWTNDGWPTRGAKSHVSGSAARASRCARGTRHHESSVNAGALDRKSTRLNSSHLGISYAVFCLKKKKKLK